NVFKDYVIISFVLFYFTEKTRKTLYRKTIEQQDELKNREETIAKKVQEVSDTKVALEVEKLKSTHLIELNVMAAQVSHDIRSPLADLEMFSRYIPEIDEERRSLLRSAVGRIKDISNTLLQRNRKYLKDSPAKPSNPAGEERENDLSVQLLPNLIDSILSEK